MKNKVLRNFKSFDIFKAGIVLQGKEVKLIKKNNYSLEGSYIIVKDNEAYIKNLKISSFERNDKKLLLKKREIIKISNIYKRGMIAIPSNIFIEKGWIKVEILIGKKLKKYQIKLEEKKIEIKREILINDE